MSFINDAGRVNPKGFHTEFTESRFLFRDYFLNGVYQNTQSLGLRAISENTDIFSGRLLDNFYVRQKAGDLLPYTEYTMCKSDIEVAAGFKTHSFVNGMGKTQLYTSYMMDNGVKDYNRFLYYPLTGYAFDHSILSLAEDQIKDQGIDTSYLVQGAVAKIYSRGWDTLTFLSEFHKTVRMILSIIQSAKRLMLDLIRFLEYRKLNPLLYLNSSIAKTWLEGRYGWRILLYDIEDASNAIKSLNKAQKSRNKGAVGFERTWIVDKTSVTNLFSSIDTYSDITEYSMNIRGSAIADFIPNRFINNPILTAWELITFSFVIDWIINVGQAIAALSFLTINDRYTSCIGYHIEARRTGQLFVSWHNNVSGTSTQTVIQNWELKRRHPRAASLIPKFANRLDLPKIVDLYALLTQLLNLKR